MFVFMLSQRCTFKVFGISNDYMYHARQIIKYVNTHVPTSVYRQLTCSYQMGEHVNSIMIQKLFLVVFGNCQWATNELHITIRDPPEVAYRYEALTQVSNHKPQDSLTLTQSQLLVVNYLLISMLIVQTEYASEKRENSAKGQPCV